MANDQEDLITRHFPAWEITRTYVDSTLLPKLEAMYGLLSTIEESLIRASDPIVSQAKLTWWFEALEKARESKGNHPVILQLQESGALVAWSQNLMNRLFGLALARIDSANVNDEESLYELCQPLGLIQLELEAAFQPGLTVPDDPVIRNAAAVNGLMQILRECFKSRQSTHYWIPLVELARCGVERSEISGNPSGIKPREVIAATIERFASKHIEALDHLPFQNLPPSFVAKNRHWFLFSLLQGRQLDRLGRDLSQARGQSTYNLDPLMRIRLNDAWFAWRMARRMNAGEKN